MLTAALLAVVAGSIVYSVLTLIAARDYLGQANSLPHHPRDSISVLKPLSGAEEQLEQNLGAVFLQQYEDFEILFAVRHADDPAVGVVEKLRAEYPAVPVRLITHER